MIDAKTSNMKCQKQRRVMGGEGATYQGEKGAAVWGTKEKETGGWWPMDWDHNGSLSCEGGRAGLEHRVDQEESKRI